MLPPLTQETVLLDLDTYALKTYNVIQAALLIKAVDSERRDQVSVCLATSRCSMLRMQSRTTSSIHEYVLDTVLPALTLTQSQEREISAAAY